jgi:DNA polymerase-2
MENIKGFIVDNYWDERDSSLNLFLNTNEGTAKVKLNNERPLFFVPSDANLPSDLICDEIKELPLKSFDRKTVKAIYFKSIEQLNRGKEVLARDGIRSFENDLKVESRFTMERFIHGSCEVHGDSNKDGSELVFVNPQLKAAHFNPRLSSLSLDIETARDGRLLSIGLAFYKHGGLFKEICYMLGDQDREVSETLVLLDSQKKLLMALNQFFKEYDPDLILGWHIVGFDLKFLFNKSLEFDCPLYLARNGDRLKVNEVGNNTYCDLRGRQIIDGPPVLRQNFYTFKNYKLDTVAHELLGTGKDIESTGESKVEEIERRFEEDKEGLAHYNLLDCKLVYEVFDKIKLIGFISGTLFFTLDRVLKK